MKKDWHVLQEGTPSGLSSNKDPSIETEKTRPDADSIACLLREQPPDCSSFLNVADLETSPGRARYSETRPS